MKNSAITMDRQQFLRLLCGGAAALATGLPANAAASGSIKVSFRSSIKRIDPAFAMSGDEYAVTQALYDNLTTLDDKFAPRPSLAESWSSPDQGRTWVFKLRSGVRFHTGREFDAEDVAFSIKRVIAKDSGSPGRRAIGPIEDVVATDPRTVTFKLEVAYADFPTVMAQTFARIVPRDGSGNLDQKPVGTGPFKFAEWMPGQHVRLVANEDYWQSGTPKVKDLWFVTYPAQAAEQAALSSGETQVMWEVAPSLVSAIKGIGGVELTEIPSTAFQPLVMRSGQAALQRREGPAGGKTRHQPRCDHEVRNAGQGDGRSGHARSRRPASTMLRSRRLPTILPRRRPCWLRPGIRTVSRFASLPPTSGRAASRRRRW